MKSFFKIIIWLQVLSLYNNACGQAYYNSYEKIPFQIEPFKFEKKVDSLMMLSIKNGDFFSYREIAHRYAIKLYRKGKYSKAIAYVLLEVENFENNNKISIKYTNALYALGRFYYSNMEYEKANYYYGKVVEINNNEVRTGQAYAEIGRCYGRMRNYSKSSLFYQKGVNILSTLKEYRSLINQYVNYSLVLRDIGTERSIFKATQMLERADSLSKVTKITVNNKLGLINTIAFLNITDVNYNFEIAYKNFKESLNLLEKINDSNRIAETYINLSYLFYKEKKDSTKYFALEGLKYANFPEAKARLHDNLCDYQIRKKEFEEALKSIHTSLEIMTISDIDGIPTHHQINQSILRDYTLYCLKKKAEIYVRLYIKEQDRNHLKNAIKNIEAAEYVVNLLLNGTTEQSTQLIWRREASQAYLYGAYASHLLGDSEKAFSFMEKNKALLLNEGILKNTEFANLPKHISDQETKLKKQIYELENELSKNEGNSVLQDSLFNAKLFHEKYVDSLKTVYPKYFARKVDVAQVPLEEVKKEIKSNQAIVSYIWNEFDRDKELIIGFVTTKDKSTTFEIENVENLKAQIKKYQDLVSKPFSTKEEQESYKETAYQLYQSLFPSQEVQNLIKGKNLLIIPDGNLQNIPFESLITKQESNEYLILNGDVNYSYSYSFLRHNEKVERNTTQDFIGYSPVSFQTDSLSSLNNSKEELQLINSELDGIAKLQDTATKEDFLSNSRNSKIIHLATHADAGENPWIAFADKKLELHELYTYKNNADLVTLSACNTSLGEVAKGEGVLSLARGFFYSGSKSVVSSLWEVNDKSTSEIMTGFYKNLKEGQTKSEAINNAKRDYLQTHSLSEQSPYYWSSFILIGDAGSMDISDNYYLYFLAAALIFFTLLFFRKKIKIFG